MRTPVKFLFILALLPACTTQVQKPVEPDDTEVRVNQEADAVASETLLQAERLLQDDQPEKALALLLPAFPDNVSAPLQARRYLLRALAHQQSDFIKTIEERLRYNDYLTRPADVDANTTKIWDTLNRVEKDTLQQLHQSNPNALSGWLELALINRTLLADPAALSKSLASWRDKYPAHPANSTITGQILDDSRRFNVPARQVALLLPFRGGYGKASEAIRDGFITAWYHSDKFKPLVKIYNANSLNIEQVYRQAIEEGADFIVGPLEKQAIKKLSESTDLSVSTLALNQVGTLTESTDYNSGNIFPDLVQFGLPPEDEARQIAERAYADGADKALVIVPDDNWGQRLHGAFRETWLALGGKILETIAYDPRGKDYSPPVKEMLNIDSSEARAGQLRRKLNIGLENETRRRQDADMIFMVGAPIAARQLIPQFRFHQAEQIPVYATSHVFTGNANPQADQDMNGVMFTDMPWILFPDDKSLSIHPVINTVFQADESANQRLYALGVDAFRLIPHLPRLAFEDDAVFSGETGQLSMSGDGRIIRKLSWGKIIDGKPELLDKDDNKHFTN